jgi:hypothetical protein
VAQYEAVSFGDALFSSFLLLPLQQRYNNMLRKAVWNEHTGIFRSFGLPFDEVRWSLVYRQYTLFFSEKSSQSINLLTNRFR